jgi:hypothetical protein
VFEGPKIIWAASRTASSAERKIIAQTARVAGAQTRTTSMSSLGTEILGSLVQGAVIVIVDSRKDAATALRLGADETVRVAQSVGLRKSTLQSAIERATAQCRARTRLSSPPVPQDDYPGLSLLMRVVERHLGGPLNQAALMCSELAEELSRAVAVADALMQRARSGPDGEELKGWSKEVKHYAQATLRAETLVAELRDQVERGDVVVRLLGDLTAAAPIIKTDVAVLLPLLAELLRADVGERISIEVVATDPCYVDVPRPALLCIICGAVENALENIRANGESGRLELRASGTDTEVLIEVTDDGYPNATDLRATFLDSLLTNPGTARLRELRERVRRMDGEMTVDADDGGTVLSLYLPLGSEQAALESKPRPAKLQLVRRER